VNDKFRKAYKQSVVAGIRAPFAFRDSGKARTEFERMFFRIESMSANLYIMRL
jgi:hypothetical protein